MWCNVSANVGRMWCNCGAYVVQMSVVRMWCKCDDGANVAAQMRCKCANVVQMWLCKYGATFAGLVGNANVVKCSPTVVQMYKCG
jgi:hypothetical protein